MDRAQFISDRIWAGGDEDRDDIAVDRGIGPTAWEEIVYDATMPIVTQFDDGMSTWPKQGYPRQTGCGTG